MRTTIGPVVEHRPGRGVLPMTHHGVPIMRVSTFVRPHHTLLAVAMLAIGCGPNVHQAPSELAPQETPRKAVRSSEVVLTVDTAPKAAAAVEHFVTEVGGFVERSTENGDGGASLECRVPTSQLEPTMDRVAALGHEERRTLSTGDVTAEYTDLEARLRSSIALRDRLQQLLAQASNVTDVLTVERELARVQGDIERMQARLERLKSEVQLADLSVTLQRKHVLGPLGYVGYGLWWGVSKLFVLR